MLDLNYHINYVGFADPEKDRSILKDAMGRWRLNLFVEFNYKKHERYPPIYTMKEESQGDLPSAYLIYMYSENEYEAAMKLVGSYAHWLTLCKSPAFMNGVLHTGSWTGLNTWREEKEIKDRATMYSLLKIQAAQGNVTAQKILFEKDKKISARGRPSKAQIEQAAKDEATYKDAIKDDLKRVRLVVSNGD